MNDTKAPNSRWLKSTEWLAGQIGKPNVVVVDASYYLPIQKRDPKAEYVAAHIPGAVFFDLNAIADASTDLPHMLPGPDQFGAAVGALGIAETDTIVVYDATGLYSAPRPAARWTSISATTLRESKLTPSSLRAMAFNSCRPKRSRSEERRVGKERR